MYRPLRLVADVDPFEVVYAVHEPNANELKNDLGEWQNHPHMIPVERLGIGEPVVAAGLQRIDVVASDIGLAAPRERDAVKEVPEKRAGILIGQCFKLPQANPQLIAFLVANGVHPRFRKRKGAAELTLVDLPRADELPRLLPRPSVAARERSFDEDRERRRRHPNAILNPQPFSAPVRCSHEELGDVLFDAAAIKTDHARSFDAQRGDPVGHPVGRPISVVPKRAPDDPFGDPVPVGNRERIMLGSDRYARCDVNDFDLHFSLHCG